MNNEITINGEVYVKKIPFTHQAAKKPAKPWPQEGDDFYLVDENGEVCRDTYNDNDYECELKRKRGNFFRTQEEAKMYSLRIESLSKGFMPKVNEWFWEYDFYENKCQELMCVDFGNVDLFQPKFPTEEECQEWYNQYGESWEALLEKKVYEPGTLL